MPSPVPPATASEWTLYECSHCGVSPTNRANWCDLGCGRDYNEMRRVVVARPEDTARKIADWIDRNPVYGAGMSTIAGRIRDEFGGSG